MLNVHIISLLELVVPTGLLRFALVTVVVVRTVNQDSGVPLSAAVSSVPSRDGSYIVGVMIWPGSDAAVVAAGLGQRDQVLHLRGAGLGHAYRDSSVLGAHRVQPRLAHGHFGYRVGGA